MLNSCTHMDLATVGVKWLKLLTSFSTSACSSARWGHVTTDFRFGGGAEAESNDISTHGRLRESDRPISAVAYSAFAVLLRFKTLGLEW